MSTLFPYLVACSGDDKETRIIEQPNPDEVILFGTIEGVPEGGVLLRNGEQTKRVNGDGLHELFLVNQGDTYNIDVAEPPYDSQCDITNPSGTGSGDSVRNISISCYDIDSAPILHLFSHPSEVDRYNSLIVYAFSAKDIEEQDVTVSWTLVSSPAGSSFTTEPEIAKAYPPIYEPQELLTDYYHFKFVADTAGQYEFSITASDGNSESTMPLVITLENIAPIIYIPEIYPRNASSLQALSLSYVNVYDTEETVSYTVQWLVNDVVVDGVNDLILPPENFIKDDIVTVVVTATDGLLTSTSEKSITIADAMGMLSLVNMPASVTEGSAVEFSLVWEDPDNDTLPSNIILNGPPGSSVDEAGTVRWQPPTLLFDQQSFTFDFSISDDDNSLVTGVINVTKPTGSSSIVKSATTVGLDNGSKLLAISKNNTGDEDKIFASNGNNLLFSMGYADSDYSQDWVQPYQLGQSSSYSNRIRSIVLADINDDDIDDVFVAKGTELIILDGSTKKQISEFSYNLAILDMEVADLNNNGQLQVILLLGSANDGNVYISDVNDLENYTVLGGSRYSSQIEIGNVDADASLEIISVGGGVYDGTTLANEWIYSTSFGRDLAVGDIDNDGIDEIISSDRYTDTIAVFDAVNKSLLHETTSTVCSLFTEDISGDAAEELITGPCYNGSITAYTWSANALTVNWTSSNTLERDISQLTSGDVDGDGNIEIIYRNGHSSYRGHIGIIDITNTTVPEWSTGNQGQFTYGYISGGVLKNSSDVEYATFLVKNYDTPSYTDEGTRVVSIDASGELSVSSQINSDRSRGASLALGKTSTSDVLNWVVGFDNYCAIVNAVTEVVDWVSGVDSSSYDCNLVSSKDLNQDGIDEIAFINRGRLEIFDVENDKLVWANDTTDNVTDYLISNIDNDADFEIIISGAFGLKVYDFVNSSYTQTAHIDDGYRIWTSYDINNDGNLELVVSNSNYYSTGPLSFLSSTLEVVTSYDIEGTINDVMFRSDENGKDEIIIAQRLDSSYSNNTQLVSYDVSNGNRNWVGSELIGTAVQGSLKEGFSRPGGDKGIIVSTESAMYIFP